jgi:hypothetical protein
MLGLIDAGDGLGLAEQFHRGDLAAVDRRVNRVVAAGVSLAATPRRSSNAATMVLLLHRVKGWKMTWVSINPITQVQQTTFIPHIIPSGNDSRRKRPLCPNAWCRP